MTLQQSIFQDDSKANHLITVTSPVLNSLGLVKFTKSQIEQWWNDQAKPVSVNNISFNTLDGLLGLDINSNSNNYTFRAWRKENDKGRYVKYSANNLNNWEFYQIIAGNKQSISGSYLVASEIIDENNLFPDWFYQIIGMHDSYIQQYSQEPDFNNWDDKFKARKLLSNDIVISRGINWWHPQLQADFSLQLFEPGAIKNTVNTVGQKNLIFTKKPTDILDRQFIFQANGEWGEASIADDPTEYLPGELSMTWNPVSKKYESGNLLTPAVLTTDIAAANPRDKDFLENLDVESMVDNPDMDSYMNMPTGEAIVLMNINGNPSLLGPTYQKEDGKREGDLTKAKVTVYNPFSRSFSKNQNVFLVKSHGVWMPIDAGQEAVSGTKPISKKFQERWSFAYFMTNVNHFYIKKDGTRFRYEDYEAAGRGYFYTSLDGQEDWSKEKYDDFLQNVFLGHFQVTSFDFAPATIGGLRESWSIGNTHLEFDSSTAPYDIEFLSRMPGTLTAPFFGCVFPDGYSDEKINRYNNQAELAEIFSNYNIKPNYTTSNLFLKVIQSTSSIFTSSEQNKGNKVDIFPKNNDGSLKDITASHLPADIALSASWSGVNGTPIRIFENKPFIFRNFGYYNYEFGPFPDPTWHYYDLKSRDIYDYVDSFFDFKPTKKNRIQFRPLKLETYACLELTQQDYQLNRQNVRANRGIFGWRSRDTQKDFQHIMSNKNGFLQQRLIPFSGECKNNEQHSPKLIDSEQGFRYNPDFVPCNTQQPDDLGNINFKPTIHPRYNGNRGDEDYNALLFYNDWNLNPICAAGGIGVIGAQYTTSASNYLVFDTKSILGQQPWIKRGTFGAGGSVGVVSVSLGVGFGGVSTGFDYTRNGSSWGKCENYFDLNTTGLFVRVFEAWPREQTVYDPRYFSVFHFNPLPMINSEIYHPEYGENLYDYYRAGVELSQEEIGLLPPEDDAEWSYPDKLYKVEKTFTNVDIKVPTNFNGEEINDGERVTGDTLRKYEDWNIDRRRYGALLPFKYIYKTVGVGDNDWTVGNPPQENKILIIPKLDLQQWDELYKDKAIFINYEFVIYNQGTGYTNEDLFTVIDGEGVVLKAVTEDGGKINNFVLINRGKNLSKFFPKKSEEIFKDEKTLNPRNHLLRIKPLKLGPLSKGTNFEGYITTGSIYYAEGVDEKPVEVSQGAVKLTPNPTSNNDITYEPSFITKIATKKTNSDGTVESYSKTEEYDLFFHFHNDTSHTLMSSEFLGVDERWAGAWENGVTLTITSE